MVNYPRGAAGPEHGGDGRQVVSIRLSNGMMIARALVNGMGYCAVHDNNGGKQTDVTAERNDRESTKINASCTFLVGPVVV
jgi:hypothetical protein